MSPYVLWHLNIKQNSKDKLGGKAKEDHRIENVLENGYSIDLIVNIKLVLNWAKHVKKIVSMLR